MLFDSSIGLFFALFVDPWALGPLMWTFKHLFKEYR